MKSKLVSLLPLKIADVIKHNNINSTDVDIKREKLSLSRTAVYNNGKNNKIIIADGARLSECTFHFSGDNNMVVIGEGCKLNKVKFWLEDSGNKVTLGSKTTTSGACEFAAIEGTKIAVGEDCMFSGEIRVCTGDSHSILQNGERINPSCDVNIGDHVWVGTKVNILKGARISEGSVVGTGAIVSSAFEQKGIVVAGVPAKKVKENITWERKRI